MSKLNDEVISAVSIGNLKAISEQPAMLSNLAFANVVATNNLGQQNAVSNQRTLDELSLSTLAKGTNTISNLDPLEARSAVDVLSNNELAQTIADLQSSLQAFAAPGGAPVPQPLRLLRQLLELGLRFVDGVVIVPPDVTIRIPGRFEQEDVSIVLDDRGVTIKVKVRVQ
ncbi:MAG: hypothetical protein EKK52_01310 [Burkholderiales bacterium]|jgi:hypothetical protein|nr:MAG: hypothetical protein EKK52_01310 [Burkholderiales bacterium]